MLEPSVYQLLEPEIAKPKRLRKATPRVVFDPKAIQIHVPPVDNAAIALLGMASLGGLLVAFLSLGFSVAANLKVEDAARPVNIELDPAGNPVLIRSDNEGGGR